MNARGCVRVIFMILLSLFLLSICIRPIEAKKSRIVLNKGARLTTLRKKDTKREVRFHPSFLGSDGFKGLSALLEKTYA